MDHNVNFPEVDKIKAHVRKNKKWYQGFGFGLAAGITLIMLKGQYAGLDKAATTVFARPLFLFSNHNKMVNVVAVVAGEGRGHPGFPVICKETGHVFLSQKGAALWAEVSDRHMSRHLNGMSTDVDGWHFQRLSAIPAVPV
jgi:hypothetical protein